MHARCPKCGRLFGVSARAADNRVRCPACRDALHQQASESQTEDTIVQWILQDVGQIDAMRKRHQNLLDTTR